MLCFLASPVLKVPAAQLVEHASAIVADDLENGFHRTDPFLKSIAKVGAKHAVT